MKPIVALLAVCTMLLLCACRPSPQKLLATAKKYHQNKKYKEADILYQKVIAKDKRNAEAYYGEGINLLDEGQPGAATRFLRRAVDLNPANTDAASKLAEIDLAAFMSNPVHFKQLMPEAQDLATKILQHDPNSFTGLRLEGLIAFASQKPEAAAASFAKANQVKPYTPEVVGWYAESLVLLKRQEEAKVLVRETLNHNKAWPGGYLFLYAMAGKENDRAAQEAILREHVQNQPKDAGALVQLADFLGASNRFAEGESVIRQVLNDPQAFPTGHELVGEYYTRARRFDQALQQFQAGAAQNNQDKVRYQQRIIAVTLAEGHREQALQLARDLAAANPKDGASNELYARLLLQTGLRADAAKSIGELKNLVQKEATNAMLHLDLSEGYLATGQADTALSEANEALQDAMKSKSHRTDILIPAHLLIGRIQQAKGQHAKALEQAQQILKIDTENRDARLLRAQALLGLGETDQAKPDLQKLVAELDQANNHSEVANQARLSLGQIAVTEHDFAIAERLFTAVWQGNPPDYRGFESLQEMRLIEGKPDVAVTAMKEFVQKNPNNPGAPFDLGNLEAMAAQLKGRKDPSAAKALLADASENYRRVLNANPNASNGWLRLGLVQTALGEMDPALASFDRSIATDSRNTAAHLQRAMLLEHVGRTREAVEGYNRVLGMDPDNTFALNNLAFLNADSKTNLEQAQTLAERAKQRAPHDVNVADTLGYVYLQRNLNREALEIFRQDVQQSPQNSLFHLHLAMALLKQGDRQAARDEAQKALKTAAPAEQNQIKNFVSQIG